MFFKNINISQQSILFFPIFLMFSLFAIPVSSTLEFIVFTCTAIIFIIPGFLLIQGLFPKMDCIRIDPDPTFKGVSPEPIERNLLALREALEEGAKRM